MPSTALPPKWQLSTAAQPVHNFPGSIGLIACGGITEHHLTAYKSLNFPVSVLCDPDREKAEQRREQFYPEAKVVTDYQQVLSDPRVTIVDVATHTDIRPRIVHDAILAKRHILSQKPFVEDLVYGRELAQLADENHIKLAINQNARWAPHFCYMRNALAAGLLGELSAVRFSIQWDHTWTRDTKFAEIKHLLLYDFAIHWFDLIQCFFRDQHWQSIYASVRQTTTQDMLPPMIAQVVVDFPNGQASLCLDADTPNMPINQTYLVGSQASIHSTGPDYSKQRLTVADTNGEWEVPVSGGWFPDGFGGAMSELVNSVGHSRVPEHNVWDNLKSLELCFAAIQSAETGRPVEPNEVNHKSS